MAQYTNLFDKAFDVVIGHEGGYVNDPNDRGGETKYGISKRAYPELNIKDLTLEQAQSIYRNDYWVKGKTELLPRELQIPYFDSCVNFGISGAIKLLQRAAGVKDDGKIGNKTLEAAARLSLDRFLLYRMERYMRIIAARNSNAKYANGWASRTLSFLNNNTLY